jgi:hypothetical protein
MTDRTTLTDDDLLKIVASECRASLGFDHDDDLAAQREKALNYIKGEMPDVASMPNRSKAVDTAVSDAIETALPDLVEIFVGGDDVATFQAQGPDDEERAKQETEFVTHVIMDQNPGFLLFYSIIKDALSVKIGVAKSWWQKKEETEERSAEVPIEAWPQVEAMAQAEGWEIIEAAPSEAGVTFKATRTKMGGCQMNMAVPPEDFTFARDTVALRDTTYCAMRSRPRAQKLIEDGYDPAKVDELPAHNGNADTLDLARDTADENNEHRSASTRALRTVEIHEHYVRCDANGDGKTELWRIVTNSDETVLLEKEEVELIPFAVITPYIVPHRLLGQSLADLLLEVQRIKTALLRMLLDSGYFALNQRLEVATDQANQFTISDLLRNEPGVPIRSKNGQAVRPVTAGGLNFDVTGALEYISTVAEHRTGIVRNAQGLNPDTLHDTADGARQLIAAAQKRIRMIARVFAETGIKDLFLNVHQLLRTHGKQAKAYIGGEWADIDPSTWPERKGLQVEIGVGSGGREHDIMAGTQLLMMQEKVIQAQGGFDGPLLGAENVYAAAKRQTERLGFRNGEIYWRDPKTYQAPSPVEPPEVQKAKLDAQVKQQAAQFDAQIKERELQLRVQQDAAKLAQEGQIKREQMAGEFQLEMERMRADFALKGQVAVLNAQVKGRDAEAKMTGQGVELGGEPG